MSTSDMSHMDHTNREFWTDGGTPVYDESGTAKWSVVESARISNLPLIERLRLITEKGYIDLENDASSIEDAIRELGKIPAKFGTWWWFSTTGVEAAFAFGAAALLLWAFTPSDPIGYFLTLSLLSLAIGAGAAITAATRDVLRNRRHMKDGDDG